MKIQRALLGLGLGCVMALSQVAMADDSLPADTMQFSKILKQLNNSGFNVVLKVEYDDGKYKASVIDAQGKQIKVTVAPTTGDVTKPKNETKQLNMMEAVKKAEEAGYHHFSKVACGHEKFEMKALNKDNKKESFEVDTKTGEISKDMF